MMELVTYPDEMLEFKTFPIKFFDANLENTVSRMTAVMYASNGVGLAFPQVAGMGRIALIDPSGGDRATDLVAMINPEVTWRSHETALGDEGCLSLPGVQLQVLRSVAVDVMYQTVSGDKINRRFSGQSARIAQHEIDHLDGVLMIDRVGSLQRREALKFLKKEGHYASVAR